MRQLRSSWVERLWYLNYECLALNAKDLNDFQSINVQFTLKLLFENGTTILGSSDVVLNSKFSRNGCVYNFERIEHAIVDNILRTELHIGIKSVDFLDDFASSTKSTDVVLVVDGKEMFFHKHILAMNSPYFKALLLGDFKEANEKKIELKDVEYNSFIYLMNIIYDNYKAIKDFHYNGIVILADKFDVLPAKQLLQDYVFQKNMHFTKKLEYADTFGWKHIKKKCIQSLKSTGDFKKATESLRKMKESTRDEIMTKFFQVAHGRNEKNVEREIVKEPVENFASESEFTDITLVVEEKSLFVSKSILAYFSPVFESMFYNESPDPTSVKIDDVVFEQFQNFLKFIYGYEFEINESNLQYLLELAHRFECEYVKNQCETYLLSKNLEISEGLKLAEQFALNKLKYNSIQKITNSTDLCTLEADFHNFTDSTKIDVMRRMREVV